MSNLPVWNMRGNTAPDGVLPGRPARRCPASYEPERGCGGRCLLHTGTRERRGKFRKHPDTGGPYEAVFRCDAPARR